MKLPSEISHCDFFPFWQRKEGAVDEKVFKKSHLNPHTLLTVITSAHSSNIFEKFR